MSVVRYTIAAICLLVFDRAQAETACKALIAPVQQEYKGPKSASLMRPTNAGIKVSGFVSVPDEEVVQGIDVSKYQYKTDFHRAATCGAKFAYIRLSGGENPNNETFYRFHWRDARAAQLLVGPYHNLAVIDASGPAGKLNEHDLAKLTQENLNYADRQAAIFSARLVEMLDKEPSIDHQSSFYLPIALDATWRPQPRGSLDDRRRIGSAYGAMICRWMSDVTSNERFAGEPVILMTSASVYHDYNLSHAPCPILKSAVWIADPTPGAVKQDKDSRKSQASLVADLCESSGNDRCRFQNYTSYGDFGIFGGPIGKDSGLDLDRFYGNEQSLAKLLQEDKR